jgi:hypothetical protein
MSRVARKSRHHGFAEDEGDRMINRQMQRTDLRIRIRLEGDSLVREMGPEAVLTPLSETRFRVGDTSLMVEFVVDDWGVTQILGSGFQQMLARRTSKR